MTLALRILLFFALVGLGSNFTFDLNYKSKVGAVTSLENQNHTTCISPSAESDETEDQISTFKYLKHYFPVRTGNRPSISFAPKYKNLIAPILSYLSLFSHSPPL